MREPNTLNTKKLKGIFIVLTALVFIFSVSISYFYTEKTSASSEEMSSCSETLFAVYRKLTPEEIKTLSGSDSLRLVHSISNKNFGKLTVFGEPDGNIGVYFDYQKTEKFFVIFASTIVSTTLGILLFRSIYQAIVVKRLKEEEQQQAV